MSRVQIYLEDDDVTKWKYFPRYWPFVRGIHQSPVNSPHKGQWRGALICVWINGWVNNREAGDLRRYRAHYDVIVMAKPLLTEVDRKISPRQLYEDLDEFQTKFYRLFSKKFYRNRLHCTSMPNSFLPCSDSRREKSNTDCENVLSFINRRFSKIENILFDKLFSSLEVTNTSNPDDTHFKLKHNLI